MTGATAGVGRALVDELLDAGHAVRAVSRQPGPAGLPAEVEVIRGAVDDVQALRAACSDVDGIFLNVFGDPRQVAKGLRDSGSGRVVLLSSITAQTRPELRHADHFRLVETTVADAVRDLSVLRPGQFMSNTLWWASELRRGDTVAAMHPRVAVPMIAPEDIATVAARVLLGELQPGTFDLLGREAFSPEDQVRSLGRLLGRTISIEPLTEEQYRARHADRGIELLDYLTATLGAPTSEERRSVDLEHVLAREPIDFASWLSRHRSDFPAPDPA